MCIWKAWKKVKTKVANLIRCGINKYKAYEWGNTCKGYWRIADSPILKRAIDNNKPWMAVGVCVKARKGTRYPSECRHLIHSK